MVEPRWTRVSFGWFAHGWNVSSGAPWWVLIRIVCNVGALLGFEVISHVVCCSQVPGMRVVTELCLWLP